MDMRQRIMMIRRAISASSKEQANIGDIVCLIDGKRTYFPYDTTENVMQYPIIGVVYAVDDNGDGTKTVRVVGDSMVCMWSCVADYQIERIPSSSGNYAVKLNNVEQGDFAYTRTDGTIKEFCEQLEAWLRSCGSSSKAAKWEAYWDEDKQKGFLQMFDYDEYESAVSINSTVLTMLVGSELASYTSSEIYNMAGQVQIRVSGMCLQRLEEHCTNSGTRPTTAMGGKDAKQLHPDGQVPCSKSYYDSNLGANLRADYPTYTDYIADCMVDLNCNKGIFYGDRKNGQLQTQLLAQKTVKKRGVAVPAYPAANYAYTYTKGVDGFEAGKWWLPSMYELSELMYGIKGDNTDPVSVALRKCGYDTISTVSSRWSCCRNSVNTAWYYFNYGTSNNNYFYHKFFCNAVSAFNIKS